MRWPHRSRRSARGPGCDCVSRSPGRVITSAIVSVTRAGQGEALPGSRILGFAIDTPIADVKDGRGNAEAAESGRNAQAAYLAGWLAARMEQCRPGHERCRSGRRRTCPAGGGLHRWLPSRARTLLKVAVLTGYSDDFADPNKCEAIARGHIARGAGVDSTFRLLWSETLRAAKRAGVWGVGVSTLTSPCSGRTSSRAS